MKKLLSILTFFAFAFIIGLTGCSLIIISIYGIKKTKTVDEKTIVRYAQKYNIPASDIYELDTAYFSYLYSLDSVKYNSQIINQYQAIYALYYDKYGYLNSFQINDYTDTLANIERDRNKIMSILPSGKQAPGDSIISIETRMKYLKPLSQTSKLSIESYDYIVIVYWNRSNGKQSKQLIQFVQENNKLEKEKKVKIIYANTDNIFSGK